tara:strand:- start:888 stop:1109 length:222 start_codon:yes stop_codon:yes gene_type:complete
MPRRKYIKPGSLIDIKNIANVLGTDKKSLLGIIEQDDSITPLIKDGSFIPYDTKIIDAIERTYRGYPNSYKAE